MRLRYFLVLTFLALAMVPVAMWRIWPNTAVLQTELDDVQERHLLLAQNLAAALTRYHRDVSTTFELMVATPTIWGVSSQVSGTLSNLGFRHICIADAASGRVLTEVARADTPCPDYLSPQHLEIIADRSGRVSLSEVVAAADGKNIIYINAPSANGRIAFGVLHTNYFKELGQTISFGDRGYAAIVDHKGNVLYHPRPDWTAERKNIATVSAVQRMMNGETGIDVFYSPALNGDVIAGFTSVEPVGWGVMIPQPVNELYEKAAFANDSAALVLLLGLTSAFLLALFISIFSSRPLEQISTAARQIAKGEIYNPEHLKTPRFLPRELRDLHSSFRDMIQKLRQSMAQINALAFVDALTGLANREAFRRYLSDSIKDGEGETFATLMFIDLDGFKAINDTKGHDAGDAVLIEVAKRICKEIGVSPHQKSAGQDALEPKLQTSGPMIARLGGDEFAVFLPGERAERGSERAAGILRALARAISIGTQKARVGASIGIARFPEDGETFSDLLKAADLAMYEAKRAGKNQVQRYTADLARSHDTLNRLAPELAEGFAQGQFDVHFQPVYGAQSFAVTSVEALLRWHHPTMGLLEAENFISAAARFGFQRQIDLFAIDQARAIVTDMKIRGTAVPKLSLNIWSDCLLDPDFVDHVIKNLTQIPCPTAIELTCSGAPPDARIVWSLDRLREAGIGIEIDDFGSGSTSILSLTEFRPTAIKIDRKLTARVQQFSADAKLVASIITMAHAQDILITAEGIETHDQIETLQAMGCDYLQGYALNGPLNRDELVHCLSGASHPSKHTSA